VQLTDGASRVGGGALPLQKLKTRLVCLIPDRLSSQEMEVRLRSHSPPIIARVERDRVMLDVRTIRERELEIVARAVRALGAVRASEKGA